MLALAEIIDHAFGPELLHGLDHMVKAVNVRLRQQPAVRVHGKVTIKAVAASRNPTADLPFFYKTEVFDVSHAHERKWIVNFG